MTVGEAAAGLLEREQELDRLRASLEGAVAHGRGAAVVLEGPAGIGKTSLLAAVRELAAATAVDPLAARGGELERDFAYGVVRQLLEPRLAAASAEARASLLQGAAALAAPLVGAGEVGARRPMGGGGDDPTAAALHGLYWLTANLAAECPLLICVDDLHWVDAASVRFLVYLARRVSELPILLVLASRPPIESHVPELLEALDAEEGVLRLEPAPLTEAAVATLLRSEIGEPAAALAAAAHSGSGGNPFLLRALVDELQRRRDDPSALAPDRIPEAGGRAAARAVGQRLARLGPAAVALARAVAVLGTDVEPRHAYELADLDEAEAATAEQTLAAAGVLAPRRPLEFAHPIVRGAVAQQLYPPERAQLHLRAARLLEREGADAERLAPHLLATDARADPWVVDILRRGAARNVARGAPDAAVRYLRRALDEPPDAASRASLLAELGRAEVRAALPDAAVEHLRQAQAETADPRERAVMAQDLAIGLVAPGRYEEAVEMLAAAVEAARPVDAELSRRLEAELLCAAKLDERTLAIRHRVYDRLPATLAADTPAGRMLCATLAHERLIRGEPVEGVIDLVARAVDGGLVAEQTGDSAIVVDAGFVLALTGDFERGGRHCDEAIAEVRARGSVIGFGRTSFTRSFLRLVQGALADAESDARNAIDAAWEPGYRVARMAYGPLVEALVEQGELDAAVEALAAAGLAGELPDTFMLNFVLFARGRLALALGRRDDGVADLEELGRREQKWRAGSPAIFPYRSLIAMAIAAEDRPRALELAGEELELARRFGAAGPLGRAQRALGLVEGRERGVELLRESLATLGMSGWRLERARTLVELGAAVRRSGERREARELLHAGRELAHVCGARPLVERAHEELLATGARPRRIMRSGVDALTASERRVATMAATGMTNREIAQALFVTVRTVEVHLTHAYQKLDIAARDQLPEALTA